MLARIISMLPLILASLSSVFVTWLLCKFWYSSRYVHHKEVRPLQESQQVMQNQYGILAERIKHTEKQLLETKALLEAETNAHLESAKQLASLQTELKNNDALGSVNNFSLEIKEELKSLLDLQQNKSGGNEEAAKTRLKELINIMRQSIQEFKTDFGQKFSSSAAQQNELSTQIWQLLELNKKLSEETATLTRALNSTLSSTEKNPDRQFTLTSIQKRS
jgi:DNA anti-recombination protein RmuC